MIIIIIIITALSFSGFSVLFCCCAFSSTFHSFNNTLLIYSIHNVQYTYTDMSNSKDSYLHLLEMFGNLEQNGIFIGVYVQHLF